MNPLNLETLKQQLAKFGLNPAQWVLRPAGPNSYLLRNRLTRMTMMGSVFCEGPSVGWRSLELRSL